MLWFWLACTQDVVVVEDQEAVPQIYDAGFIDIEFVDFRGKELRATIWYPATRREGSQTDNYEPFQVTLQGYRNAPVAVSQAPLIAFSHGFYAIRFQSAYLMEYLAQHGYVSVAVDHPDNVLYDFDDAATPQVLLERPDDVMSSVDELLRLSDDPNHPLYDSVEGSQYVAIGHSFGSHTVNVLGGGALDYNGLVSFCEENPEERACQYLAGLEAGTLADHGTVDDRVIAVVPMSPGLWYTFGSTGEGLENIENSLVLAGTEDGVLRYETEALPTYQQTGSPKYLATFHNTGHYGFSNICDLLPIFTEECTEEDWADIAEVQMYSNQLIRSFVDHQFQATSLGEELSPSFWSDVELVSLERED